MQETKKLYTQINALRQQIVNMLSDLRLQTNEFELPRITEDVEQVWKKLADNSFDVLVAGEAKSGKSSFVNALIGQKLLPVDVAIATSQVFRVRHMEEEAYRLRYEEGQVREISRDELAEYGSQTTIEQGKILRYSLKGLLWIEVDIPMRFFPEGISLLDTPGIGSLYAPHTQITQRLVQRGVDAVIFIFNREAIHQLEMEFLKDILTITPHIFFILPKADLPGWEPIKQRYEEILQEHVGPSLKDIHVWPFSSQSLIDAVKHDNPAVEESRRKKRVENLVKESHQQDLVDNLLLFLFKATGLQRCKDTLTMAEHYYVSSKNVLEQRLANMNITSKEDLLAKQHAVQAHKKHIFEDWGPNKTKRQEIINKIRNIAEKNKRDLGNFLRPGGKLETSMRQNVSSVKSIKEANMLGANLPDILSGEIKTKLQTIYKEANLEVATLLEPVLALDSDILQSEVYESTTYLPTLAVKVDRGERLKQAQEGFERGALLGGAFAAAVLTHIVLPVTIPITLIGIGIAGFWGAIRLWKDTSENQLREIQQQLNEHLTSALELIRDEFFQQHSMYDDENLVTYQFRTFEQGITEKVEQILEEKIQEAEREYARLNAQITLDTHQRNAASQMLQQQLDTWNTLGKTLEHLWSQLGEIEDAVMTQSSQQA